MALVFLWGFYDYTSRSAGLNEDSAKRLAEDLVEKICREQCEKKKLKRADLRGPFPDPANSKNDRSYGFTWRYSSSGSLVVAVSDTGWTINVEYWWRDF